MIRELRECAELAQQSRAAKAVRTESELLALDSGSNELDPGSAERLAVVPNVHPATIAFPDWSIRQGEAA